MMNGAGDIDDLPKNKANYTALTPLHFLERSALVHPRRTSLVHGSVIYAWIDTYRRCRRLASALSAAKIGPGSVVVVIAPNTPAMYEAHFGVPMAGAVVNCVNIRLNAPTIAFQLEHSSSALIMVDQEFFTVAEDALKIWEEKKKGEFKPPIVIVISDESCDPASLQHALKKKGVVEYERFLETGDPEFCWQPPLDEWQSIALGYTSGTTASPKGVVLSHRGAYIMAVTNTLTWRICEGDVYLWTLPMFHCNGWCFPWTLAAISGTNICLRQVSAGAIYRAISEHKVTHFCAAPIVLNTILNASPEDTVLPLPHPVYVMTAGAPPPPTTLLRMSQAGFHVTHTYGLSETYGPSVVCQWKPEWDALPPETRARMNSRQGVRYVGLEFLGVVSGQTGDPVPTDGVTVGEVVMRGNVVMKGYLKNPAANREAFSGGWFRSGDLAVVHPDGYVEIKDRSKDIIITGGENVSSVEVENVLYLHPDVAEAAVVGRADEKWGESPCAFVKLKAGTAAGDGLAEKIVEFCRRKLPIYWIPKSVVFGDLPKTATGKVKKHVLREKARKMGPVKSKL